MDGLLAPLLSLKIEALPKKQVRHSSTRYDDKFKDVVSALNADNPNRLLMCLIRDQIGVMDDVDHATGGNILHLAARHNRIKCARRIMDHFKDRAVELLGSENKAGSTPLHLAINYGRPSVDVVKALLSVSLSEKENESYRKVLNKCDRRGCKKCRFGSNQCGFTALHLAVRMNIPEIVRELGDLTPYRKASDGNDRLIPLQMATRFSSPATLAAVLETFYVCGSHCVNEQSENGDTALLMCIRNGDVDKVRMLLQYGARLSPTEPDGSLTHGKTALHELVKATATQSEDTIIQIYKLVVDHAIQWWHDAGWDQLDNTEVADYDEVQRQAMLNLTCNIRYKGMNVLQYAAYKGAGHLLSAILVTSNVFHRKISSNHNRQDITFLTPEAMPQNCLNEDVSCIELIINSEDPMVAEKMLNYKPFSYLVLPYKLVSRYACTWVMIAAHLTFMVVFTYGVLPRDGQWLMNRCVSQVHDNGTSNDVLGWSGSSEHLRYVNNSSIEPESGANVSNMMNLGGVCIIWPAINLALTLTSFAIKIYFRHFMTKKINILRNNTRLILPVKLPFSLRDPPNGENRSYLSSPEVFTVNKLVNGDRQEHRSNPTSPGEIVALPANEKVAEELNDSSEEDFQPESNAISDVKRKTTKCDRIFAWYRRVGHLTEHATVPLSLLAALLFLALVVWCYVEHNNCSHRHMYVISVSVTLAYGWTYTTMFFTTFSRLMTLTSIVRVIIKRDMVSFFVLYVFFLVGFALAFQTLAQATDHSDGHRTMTFGFVLYTVFCQMVGAESVVENLTFDDDREMTSTSLVTVASFARLLLVVYICFTMVILLNLLIAMMNDTYSGLAEQAQQSIAACEIKLIRNILVIRRFPVMKRLLFCWNQLHEDTLGRFVIDEPLAAG